MPKPSFFSRELFQFLVELKFNNERAWFQANKARYEEHLKGPFQRFIEAALPRVTAADKAYDSASFFRIYRDTRFSKDKTPYKTHGACQFRHRAMHGQSIGVAVHAPGFYFHVEPGENMLGAGIWAPEPGPLLAVRKRIAAKDPAWLAFKRRGLPLGNWDDLKRVPKGFDPEHPLAADLRHRHYIAMVGFTDSQVCAPGFLDRFSAAVKELLPLNRFLCAALKLR